MGVVKNRKFGQRQHPAKLGGSAYGRIDLMDLYGFAAFEPASYGCSVQVRDYLIGPLGFSIV